MKISDIEKRTRIVLMDEQEQFRWSSAFIRMALEDAIAFLHSIRPETKYVNGECVGGIELPEDGDAEFSVDVRYREGIVAYVAHKCLERDNSDTQNLTLSETYLNKAKTLMQL